MQYISSEAFEGCTSLTKVIVNDIAAWCNISFGDNPLSYAHHLYSDENTEITDLVIPNSVTSIGGSAFSGCSGLTSVTIPNSVTSIGQSAFVRCSGLTSIVVEGGNTVYDSRDNCNAIIRTADNVLIVGCQNTVIPNSVTSIGRSAFSGCSGLTSVTIPNSVTSIGDWAFYGCSGLTSVTIPNNVTSIGSSAFSGCSGLTSVTIPNSVASIGSHAFMDCSGLTSVTITNSGTTIGYSAFSGCSRLTSVKVRRKSPQSISSETFSNRARATLYVPVGSKTAYQHAEYWKEFKEIVEYEEQTLALESLPTMTYGDADYNLPERTVEGLTLTWESNNTAVATISGHVLTIKGAGTATVTATQAGNAYYQPFSREFTLTVDKATLTITANDQTKVEGEENPELTVSYEGFQYDDDESVLTQQPTVTTTATTDSPIGTYPITVSGAEAANYDISYVDGTLTVEEYTLEPTDISQIDNVIYINPQEVRTASQATLQFKMKNNVPIRGFMFDLYMPEGMTAVTSSNGKVQASLIKTRLPEDDEHQLTTSIQSNGAVRFLCNSQYDENFAVGDDVVLTLKVNVSEDMQEGEYPLDLLYVKLSETNIDNYYLTELVRSTVTVSSYILGDVNADGVVDISDYISEANYIHGSIADGFVFKAGDIDSSGRIDITDYIGISNIIHTGSPYGGSQAGAKAVVVPFDEADELDPQ